MKREEILDAAKRCVCGDREQDYGSPEIKEQISGILNIVLKDELRSRYSDTGREISSAVKDLIYSQKDRIIEMVVDRASAEIVRKGLPKLMDKMIGGADNV